MLGSVFLNAFSSIMALSQEAMPVVLLGAVLAAALAWALLISKALRSHFNTPSIQPDRIELARSKRGMVLRRISTLKLPLVSVIVPARNEEAGIRECLLSVLRQRDANFEVIAVDDNSTDGTLAIMRELQEEAEFVGKLRVLSVEDKPEGWTGKTWASQQGYLHSNGKVLLFMDADGHLDDPDAIRLTLERMLSENLDVLTGVPFLPLKDFWSRVVMPVWNLYSEVFGRGIADANDPDSNVAFVMGSYFMIRRSTFESVGTYERVRHEIQEDASMGRLLKEGGYSVRMFKIDSLVTALWSRDLSTLWNGIKRTVIPVALRQSTAPLMQQLALVGMIIFPFVLWPFLASYEILAPTGDWQRIDLLSALFLSDSLLCLAIVIITGVKGMRKYRQSPAYSMLCFAGAAFLVVCSAYSVAPIILGRGAKPVSWRGRPHAFSSQGSGEPEAAPA